MFAIYFVKPGTTLAFWLNRFYAGGFIWSLVRTPVSDRGAYQPALRFESADVAQSFIAEHLGGNPNARIVRVEN